MKLLTLLINQCGECEWRTNNSKSHADGVWVCGEMNKPIPDLCSIPEWCPLPEGRRRND